MLKKTLSLILATALACSAGSALALNYSGSQGNEATFELLEEARVSAPAAVQHLELNESKTFVSFPVLDGIPEGYGLCLPQCQPLWRPGGRPHEYQPAGICRYTL